MGTQNEGGGDGNPAADAKKDKLYEDRPTSKKIIRVVTVIAYMVSVSFVAIVLSGYYVFLWHPPNPRLMHRAQHLRADPQIEYLVDKPPTEVTMNETLSAAEIRDKVNVFREEFLRNHGVNIFSRSQEPESFEERAAAKNSNVSHVDRVNLTNSSTSNSSGDSGSSMLSPIVRSLLATTEIPKTQIKLENSTVYENVATKSWTRMDSLQASTVFTKTPEINESSLTATRLSSSSFNANSTEREGKLYNVSVNDFPSTIAQDTPNREKKYQISTWPTKRLFSSVAKSTTKRITPTRAYELLKNSGNPKVSLDRIGNNDQHITTNGYPMETSGIREKVDISNVRQFRGSNSSQITQVLKESTSARLFNDQSTVFTSTQHSDLIGKNKMFRNRRKKAGLDFESHFD